ncbi:hypothetical protein BC830DRAFT_1174143 [Chytriomyces sp. MP71]|nr:hypothetical protein BC830DRAFT_1174143 [Chytriomyces sp. MP71]
MFFGFILCPVARSTIAWHWKEKLGEPLHRNIVLGIDAAGFAFFAIGIALVKAYASKTSYLPTVYSDDTHKTIGLVLACVFVPLNTIFHWIKTWLKSRGAADEIPLAEKIYWINEWVCFCTAFVNVHFGLTLFGASTGFLVIYWLFITIVAVGALWTANKRMQAGESEVPVITETSQREDMHWHHKIVLKDAEETEDDTRFVKELLTA